jgi:hypothetical protein
MQPLYTNHLTASQAPIPHEPPKTNPRQTTTMSSETLDEILKLCKQAREGHHVLGQIPVETENLHEEKRGMMVDFAENIKHLVKVVDKFEQECLGGKEGEDTEVQSIEMGRLGTESANVKIGEMPRIEIESDFDERREEATVSAEIKGTRNKSTSAMEMVSTKKTSLGQELSGRQER